MLIHTKSKRTLFIFSEDGGILHLSCGKLSVKITVDVNRALEIQSCCGVCQFCVCLRVIDSVKCFMKRQATFFHQHKYEVSYSAFVHIVYCAHRRFSIIMRAPLHDVGSNPPCFVPCPQNSVYEQCCTAHPESR